MIVLLHLGPEVRRAQVVRQGEQDRLDLCVHADGYTIEVYNARRGVEDGQWEPLPTAEPPHKEVRRCESPDAGAD